MPEIINLLKGFQMCEFPSEDWALAILRLTFNILTSYFKVHTGHRSGKHADSTLPIYIYSVSTAETEVSSGQLSKSRILNNK